MPVIQSDDVMNLQKYLLKTTKSLNEIDTYSIDDYCKEKYMDTLLLGIVRNFESMAILARNMITEDKYSLEKDENLCRQMYMDPICGVISFETIHEFDIEKIVIHRLLPHRKSDQVGKKYLTSKYYGAIQERFKNREPYTEKVVIWYRHHYGEKEKGIRDHDNIETKFMTDMLSSFLLIDDSPDYSEFHESSVKDKTDFTEILFIPCKYFPAYWDAVENGSR